LRKINRIDFLIDLYLLGFLSVDFRQKRRYVFVEKVISKDLKLSVSQLMISDWLFFGAIRKKGMTLIGKMLMEIVNFFRIFLVLILKYLIFFINDE